VSSHGVGLGQLATFNNGRLYKEISTGLFQNGDFAGFSTVASLVQQEYNKILYKCTAWKDPRMQSLQGRVTISRSGLQVKVAAHRSKSLRFNPRRPIGWKMNGLRVSQKTPVIRVRSRDMIYPFRARTGISILGGQIIN